MKTHQKLIALFLVSAFGIFAFSCRTPQAQNTNAVSTESANANTEIPPEKIIEVEPSYAQTPTDAYTGLYEAVKAKDTEKIKSFMTQETLAFAQGQAQMTKQSMAEMVKNGFLATTMAEKLPEIRDQRIKDDMGAVEVYNEKEKKWEDTFFMFENGGWKLAVGEAFSGKYKSPGKGKAQIELDASNKTLGPGSIPQTDSNAQPKMPPSK